MTVQSIGQKTISVKDLPKSLVPSQSTLTWTRPGDWLAMPSIGPTDQKFAGLYAVMNDGANFVSLLATTDSGTFTVDWGDGTAPQTYTSGTKVSYTYTYSSISAGTTTSEGWRQVIITVTPTSGNLTGMNIQQLYTTSPALSTSTILRWKEIVVGGPSLTTLSIGGTYPTYIEQATIVSHATVSPPSYNGLFQNCFFLQSVIFYANTSNVLSTSTMFSGCRNLRIAPLFDTSSVTDATNMFFLCYLLQIVPSYNFTKVTTMFGTFIGCTALQTIPYLNTSNVTITANTFSGCSSLTTIPVINTINVSNTQSMFNGCKALTATIPLNLSNVLNASLMYNNSGVITASANLINATNTSNMFTSCSGLITVSSLNISNSLNSGNMFYNCSSLINLPTLDTSKATTLSNMFLGCSSLKSIPSLTSTGNATSMNGLFQNCYGLSGNITIDIRSATNINGIVASCNNISGITFANSSANTANIGSLGTASIQTVKDLNCISGTVAGNVFSGALSYNLTTLANVTNIKFATSFANCMFSKDGLESMIANSIATVASSQTLTISGNFGADAAIAKTGSGITAGSNVVTMASTTGITSGMYLYGTGIQTGIPVTFTAATSRATYTNAASNQPMQDGARVMFTAIVTTTGITTNTTYYVVNSLTTGFQLSATFGGAPITLTNNGTGTMSIGNVTGSALPCVIQTVNAGNVIIAGVSGLTNAAASLTVRSLNTTLASVKNWAVAG